MFLSIVDLCTAKYNATMSPMYGIAFNKKYNNNVNFLQVKREFAQLDNISLMSLQS